MKRGAAIKFNAKTVFADGGDFKKSEIAKKSINEKSVNLF